MPVKPPPMVGGVLQEDGSLVCGDCGCVSAKAVVMHASRSVVPNVEGASMRHEIKEPPADDDCHCHAVWRYVNRKPAVKA